MAVRRRGTGPALVYLHGLGETGACWDVLVREPPLAGFTHVLPDLPGYGQSPRPAPPATLDELADALVAWLGERGPAVLIGHSMGGVLGVLVAERAPALVRGLVSVDGNVSPGDAVFSSRAAAMTEDVFVNGGGFARLCDELRAGAADSAALRGYVAALRFADPRTYHRHALDLVAISAPETMATRLARLPMPAIYVAGVPDGACTRSRALLEAAGARWVGGEPAGHWVFVDQPAPCAAIIADLALQAG